VLTGSGHEQNQLAGSLKWIVSSASAAGIGGVGVLLSARASANVVRVKSVSERVLLLEFTAGQLGKLVVLSSPTNCAPDSEVQAFYDTISAELDSLPRQSVLYILGDLNARLGMDRPEIRLSCHQNTNRNGDMLGDFCLQHELVSCSTLFQKKTGKLWTFRGLGDRYTACLDHILVRRRFRNLVMDCEVFDSRGVTSDHRMVTAFCCLRLKARVKPPPKPPRYDWRPVQGTLKEGEPHPSEELVADVKNRYASKRADGMVDDCTAFVGAIAEACEWHLASGI